MLLQGASLLRVEMGKNHVNLTHSSITLMGGTWQLLRQTEQSGDPGKPAYKFFEHGQAFWAQVVGWIKHVIRVGPSAFPRQRFEEAYLAGLLWACRKQPMVAEKGMLLAPEKEVRMVPYVRKPDRFDQKPRAIAPKVSVLDDVRWEPSRAAAE
jgi:hypothetical protein